MEIAETRLQNLLALAEQFTYAKDFCERLGIDPSYLSQLKSRNKTLGNRLARQIEETLGLERGWLDSPHAEAAPAPAPAPALALALALIPKHRTSLPPQQQPQPEQPSSGATDALVAAIRCLAPDVRAAVTRLIMTLAAQQIDPV